MSQCPYANCNHDDFRTARFCARCGREIVEAPDSGDATAPWSVLIFLVVFLSAMIVVVAVSLG